MKLGRLFHSKVSHGEGKGLWQNKLFAVMEAGWFYGKCIADQPRAGGYYILE
jgi:hypothetical protein